MCVERGNLPVCLSRRFLDIYGASSVYTFYVVNLPASHVHRPEAMADFASYSGIIWRWNALGAQKRNV